MKSVITAGKPGSILILVCVALAALLFSGCGGGSMTVPVDDNTNQDQAAPLSGGQSDTTGPADSGSPAGDAGGPAADSGTPDVKFGTMLPLGSPLPAVPVDDAKASSKAVSTILDYPGADFMLAAGGTVDGDELVLESSDEFIAWAMYRADGLADLDIEIYSIEAVPGDLGQNYEVGFSDFNTNDWVFLINSTLPEAEVNLAEADGQFISALGNLYFLVTVDGGDSLRISVSHLLTADENPNDPPPGDDPPLPFTFIGPLLEMGDSSFTLSNEQGAAVTIGYDADTLWFGLNGEPIPPESLEPGDVLLVEAVETSAGWYALGVMLVERDGGGPGDPNDPVLLEGEILSIGNGVIKLRGFNPLGGEGEFSVNYNEETQWFNENGPAGPDDFAPGDFVLIEAVELDSGLLALFVTGLRDGDPGDPRTLTFVGEITAIDDSSLTLDQEVYFIHNEDTLWLNENGEAGPEDFEPGDIVQVDAIETDSGLVALVVMDLGGNGGGGQPREYSGPLAELGPEAFSISNEDGTATTFGYDENTMWFDFLGLPISPDDLSIGDLLLVLAVPEGEGLYALQVIQLERTGGGGGGDPLEFTGILLELNAETFTISPLDGSAVTFVYDEATQWFDSDGNQLTPDDLEIGDLLKVSALEEGEYLYAAEVLLLINGGRQGG